MSFSLQFKDKPQEDKSAPLYLLVHGRAGNKEVMWTFHRCIPENGALILPQAPLPDPVGSFSWWHVHEGVKFEDIEHAASVLKKFLIEYIQINDLTPSAIYAAGFSQGGALLSLLMQREPQLFSKVALLASFVVKDKKQVLSESVALPRILIAHGTVDETVSIEKAYEGRDWLLEKGFQVAFVEDAVGHKIGTTGVRTLKQFFNESNE